MPTNANAYNSRVTDEALEKRFRDTFTSQGGAELVDDLYAQGVIVPVVDFTQAATGQTLAQNLQTAWDFSTGFSESSGSPVNIITNAGFWQIDLSLGNDSGGTTSATVQISDGLTSKTIWSAQAFNATTTIVTDNPIVVFVRSGDTVSITTSSNFGIFRAWYRQIATVSGDLVDPSGFTSS